MKKKKKKRKKGLEIKFQLNIKKNPRKNIVYIFETSI